jgi:hypothetical protein
VPTGNRITLHVDYELSGLLLLPLLNVAGDLRHLRVTAVGQSL